MEYLNIANRTNYFLGGLGKIVSKCIYRILSAGPIPDHIAIIMDGNRRYAKKWNLHVREGHEAGIMTLLYVFKYMYELGVKYITVYAFSSDNFKRKPDQVGILMHIMLKTTQEMLTQESLLSVYGVRVQFIGNLKLLSKPVRDAAEKLMDATSNNSRVLLLVCVAYTSTDEIVHAVQESCKGKLDKIQKSCEGKAQNICDVGNGIDNVEEGNNSLIRLEDIENNL